VTSPKEESKTEDYAWNDEEEMKDLWPDQDLEDEDDNSKETAKKEK